MRQLVYTSFLLTIMLRFAFGERKICSTIKKSQNIMNMIICNFFFLFMPLLTDFMVKNSHILARICFIFLTKRPKPNSKGFQYQIWTSVKRLGKQLSRKTNFSPFLQISCSNFKLKL